MDMVEKTRRSLTVLRRCQEADREELNYWIRRYSDAEDLKKGGHSRQQSPVTPDPVALGTGPSAVCLSVCQEGGQLGERVAVTRPKRLSRVRCWARGKASELPRVSRAALGPCRHLARTGALWGAALHPGAPEPCRQGGLLSDF